MPHLTLCFPCQRKWHIQTVTWVKGPLLVSINQNASPDILSVMSEGNAYSYTGEGPSVGINKSECPTWHFVFLVRESDTYRQLHRWRALYWYKQIWMPHLTLCLPCQRRWRTQTVMWVKGLLLVSINRNAPPDILFSLSERVMHTDG